MLKPYEYSIRIIALFILILLLNIVSPLKTQVEYVSTDILMVPWGDAPECLSALWNVSSESPEWRGLIDPPGPFAVSSNGQLIIAEFNGETELLKKYDFNGTLLASLDLRSCGLHIPRSMAINQTGEVLIDNYNWDHSAQGSVATLYLFNSLLQPAGSCNMPGEDIEISRIVSSDTGLFSIRYSTRLDCSNLDSERLYEGYQITLTRDLIASAPQLLYSRYESDPRPLDGYRFNTTLGQFLPFVEDIHGDVFGQILGEPDFLWICSPEGELEFSFDLSSESGWERFRAGSQNWFVTPSGVIYTIHATSEGVVLTEFIMQLD